MSRILCGLALLGWGVSLHVHAAPSPPHGAHDAIDAARRDTVVASFNGGEVTVGEVEDAVGTATPDSLEDMSRMSYVQHFYYQRLREELQLAEAQRRGYAERPDVERRVKELAMDLMLGAVIAEPMKSFTPTEEALQEFFKTRPAELGAPELRRVVELVVASEEEARTLLPMFQAAQGAELHELIKKHSLAASRNENGNSRYFDSGGVLDDKSASVDSALAKATFALPPVLGLTSNVFALSGPEKRWGIVKVLAVRPAYVPNYQQALPVMKKILTDEQRDKERAKLEDGARATFQPKVHDELLKLLPAELGPSSGEPGSK
ncbi:MAG TPA: peptidylprolyl isomerase [Polyangiales bacterium]|nr:peptidylprolyl isomerase [Polyangiales bacterium]